MFARRRPSQERHPLWRHPLCPGVDREQPPKLQELSIFRNGSRQGWTIVVTVLHATCLLDGVDLQSGTVFARCGKRNRSRVWRPSICKMAPVKARLWSWLSCRSMFARRRPPQERHHMCPCPHPRRFRVPARIQVTSPADGCRAKKEQLRRIEGLPPESQGQNLALTVLHVPYLLDSGRPAPLFERTWKSSLKPPSLLDSTQVRSSALLLSSLELNDTLVYTP